MPVPGPDDVLIRVQSILLEPSDISFPFDSATSSSIISAQSSSPGRKRTKRFIPGRFVLGTVVALGEQPPNLIQRRHQQSQEIGMRVMALMDDKACAEFAVAHTAFVFPLSYLTIAQSQLPTPLLMPVIAQFLTGLLAHFLVYFQANITPGDTVALFAADTDFGRDLTAVLRQQNIDVITFTANPVRSSTNTLTAIGEFNASKLDHFVYERDPSVFCQADVILDPFGPSHVSIALSFLKRVGGRILSYDGAASSGVSSTSSSLSSSSTTSTATNTCGAGTVVSSETLQMLFKRSIMLQFVQYRYLESATKHALREHFDHFLATNNSDTVGNSTLQESKSPTIDHNQANAASSSAESSNSIQQGVSEIQVSSFRTTKQLEVLECSFEPEQLLPALQQLQATITKHPTVSDAPMHPHQNDTVLVVHANMAATAVWELAQELHVLIPSPKK